MNDLPRWFMVIVLILAVLGLLLWARGTGPPPRRRRRCARCAVRRLAGARALREARCRALQTRRRS